jgi:hypothetical protein
MNRRTAESAGGGQNIEVKNIVLLLSITSAVSAGGGCDIQNKMKKDGTTREQSRFPQAERDERHLRLNLR